MKEILSNSAKIRKFIDLLIEKTDKNELIWRTMSFDDYSKLVEDINAERVTARNDFNYHIQSANQMKEILPNAIAKAQYDVRVYYTEIKGTKVFLIEEVNYNSALPQSTFNLTIINVSDKDHRFKYTLEFANKKEKQERLSKLASYVIPLYEVIDDKSMAMDFIDSLIE